MPQDAVQRALNGQGETNTTEYKETFDPDDTGSWCEIVKEIVAIANTGGGMILFGIDDDGQLSSQDTSPVLNVDPAEIVDQINKYTGRQFSGIQVDTVEEKGQLVAIWKISESPIPLVFTKTGNYHENGKPKKAFRRGAVYFRHGAKSEPATQDDLRDCIERNIDRRRDAWLENIREVMEAPAGSQIQVVPPSGSGGHSEGAVRLVDESGSATPSRLVDPDETHPYRMTEVVDRVNQRLEGVEINQYDLVSMNKVHEIKENDVFCHDPKFGSTQYSKALVDWIVEQYEDDSDFFQKNRDAYYEMRHGSDD
ncbi:MAG: RNA-binding domain-containing protein [Salinibacter sp.]